METTGINKTVYRSDVISALDSFTSVRNVLAWEMFQDGQVRNYDGVINDLQRLYPEVDFDSVTENIDPESIAADEDAIYALVDNIINKLIKSGISKDNFNYAIWACDDPENVADTYGVDIGDVSAYKITDGILLQDLGYEGQLYGVAEYPEEEWDVIESALKGGNMKTREDYKDYYLEQLTEQFGDMTERDYNSAKKFCYDEEWNLGEVGNMAEAIDGLGDAWTEYQKQYKEGFEIMNSKTINSANNIPDDPTKVPPVPPTRPIPNKPPKREDDTPPSPIRRKDEHRKSFRDYLDEELEKNRTNSSLEPKWTVYEPHFKNLKPRHDDDPENGWGMMSDEKDSLIEENGGKVTVEYGHGGSCTLYGAETGDVISTFTTIKEMQDFKKNHNLTIVKNSRRNNMRKTIKSDIDWESAKHAFDDKKYLIYKTGIDDKWEEFPFYGTDNAFTADEYERKGYKVEKNMIKSSYGRYNVDNDIYAVYVDDDLVEYVANTSIPGYEYISMNEYGDIAYANSSRPTWFEKFKKKWGNISDVEEQSNVRMYGPKVLDAIEKSLKYDEYEKDMNENGTAYEFKGSDGKWYPIDPGTSSMAMCRTSNIPVRPVTSSRKPIKSSKWVEDVADKKGITFEQVLEVFKDNGYGEDEADDFWNSKWNDVSDAFGEDGIAGLDELFGIEITSARKSIKSGYTGTNVTVEYGPYGEEKDFPFYDMKGETVEQIDETIGYYDEKGAYWGTDGNSYVILEDRAYSEDKIAVLEDDYDEWKDAWLDEDDSKIIGSSKKGEKKMKIQSKRLIKSGTSNFGSNDNVYGYDFPLVTYVAENYVYDEENDVDTEERDYDLDSLEYRDEIDNATDLAAEMDIPLYDDYRDPDYAPPFCIKFRDGYYEGIWIEIKEGGDTEDLSDAEFDNLAAKINNYLDTLVKDYGWQKLGVTARFSNGETMYHKIDNSRKPVTSGLTFRQAVQDFKAAGQWNDYYEMQQDWEAYKDGLERDGVISEKTRSTWGNPCTPEGFKRWNKQ